MKIRQNEPKALEVRIVASLGRDDRGKSGTSGCWLHFDS